MTRQLTFDLPSRAALGRDDFFVSPANATALAAVEDHANWPQGKLLLVGGPGAGKTHLAHVFAEQSGGRVVEPDAVTSPSIPTLAEGPLAIDRGNGVTDEDAFFHLHNLMSERGNALLITARMPPARWPITLPDLKSRLSAVSVARLDPPDDALLTAVLAKHFNDRQLNPPPNLIPYLVSRMERSLGEAGRIVADLDAAALSERRNITRALAALVLDKQGSKGA